MALPAEAAVVEPCGAADDPDTRLVLELFPEHIRAAIVAALRAEEEAASAAAQAAATAAAAGGNNGALAEAESADAAVTASAAEAYSGGVQMVEAVVDRGRPLRVRLSSGTELVLEEELSVEVGMWGQRAPPLRLVVWQQSRLDGSAGICYNPPAAGCPGLHGGGQGAAAPGRGRREPVLRRQPHRCACAASWWPAASAAGALRRGHASRVPPLDMPA